MTNNMTHTVTCKFDKSVTVRIDTIEVRIGKNSIQDAYGNKFDLDTGRKLRSVYHRTAAQKIDLSTLTPIAA